MWRAETLRTNRTASHSRKTRWPSYATFSACSCAVPVIPIKASLEATLNVVFPVLWRRRFSITPQRWCVGDNGLGFWGAMRKLTQIQRQDVWAIQPITLRKSFPIATLGVLVLFLLRKDGIFMVKYIKKFILNYFLLLEQRESGKQRPQGWGTIGVHRFQIFC